MVALFHLKDGFVKIEEEEKITFNVETKAELFVIKSPSGIGYKRFIERY